MHIRTTVAVLLCFLLVAALGYWFVSVTRCGFSATEKPSRLEEFFARHARKIATPAGTKKLENPYPVTTESLRAAREHWAEHCAFCHGPDGSGNTTVGRNLYPKVPDLRDTATQALSDGELFSIIKNGVRFTGMPAWGTEHVPEQTWQLVSLIRRMPHLTADELKLMERPAVSETTGAAAPAHTHSPGVKPHKHDP